MDIPIWVTVLVTVIGSGGAAAAVTALFERRLKQAETKKSEADGAGTITEAAIALVEPLREQISAMRKRLDIQEAKYARLMTVLEQYAKHVEYLMTGIARLMEQLAKAGISPCWQPTPWKPDVEVRE